MGALTVFDDDVLAGQTATAVAHPRNCSGMTVAVEMTNAALSGDLGTVKVYLYTPDTAGGEPTAILLEKERGGTTNFETPLVGAAYQYDVRGVERVSIKATNAAGSTRAMRVHVYLQ